MCIHLYLQTESLNFYNIFPMNLFLSVKRTILVIDDLSSIIVSSVLPTGRKYEEVITPVQSEISLGQSWIENMVGFHPFLPLAVGGLSVIVFMSPDSRSSLTQQGQPQTRAEISKWGSVTAPWSGLLQQSFLKCYEECQGWYSAFQQFFVQPYRLVYSTAIHNCSQGKQQPFVYVCSSFQLLNVY